MSFPFEIKFIDFFFWQVGSGYSEGDPGYVERFSFAVDDLQKLAEEDIYGPCPIGQLSKAQLLIWGATALSEVWS